MNRRNFLTTSAAFGAASLMNVGGVLNVSAAPINNIGIQLYTIREMMKADFEGSITKVAEIGYKEVEFFNYFGRKAQDVKNIIDQNGLYSPSIHVDIDQLR
ncbi:MAG: twin-arginine translocation signal domain-containing protein, partial [Emcibacteraceae bacterium]|nr:twin-arginine translocation signal domain-containing protein [Emcibacteraceae bacterium]